MFSNGEVSSAGKEVLSIIINYSVDRFDLSHYFSVVSGQNFGIVAYLLLYHLIIQFFALSFEKIPLKKCNNNSINFFFLNKNIYR